MKTETVFAVNYTVLLLSMLTLVISVVKLNLTYLTWFNSYLTWFLFHSLLTDIEVACNALRPQKGRTMSDVSG